MPAIVKEHHYSLFVFFLFRYPNLFNEDTEAVLWKYLEMSATQQGENLVNFVTVGVTVPTLFKYKGRTTLRHVPTDYINFDSLPIRVANGIHKYFPLNVRPAMIKKVFFSQLSKQ